MTNLGPLPVAGESAFCEGSASPEQSLPPEQLDGPHCKQATELAEMLHSDTLHLPKNRYFPPVKDSQKRFSV
jgi:hypothetical protein